MALYFDKQMTLDLEEYDAIVFNFSDPYRSIYELQNCVEKVRQVG